ncbi:hypothetical protein KY285_026306 [Solanum tuberosum]|nr:hypothetical protein KY285_026306 [Solanum tuberosum]
MHILLDTILIRAGRATEAFSPWERGVAAATSFLQVGCTPEAFSARAWGEVFKKLTSSEVHPSSKIFKKAPEELISKVQETNACHLFI